MMSSWGYPGLGDHARNRGGPEKNSGLDSIAVGSLQRQLSDVVKTRMFQADWERAKWMKEERLAWSLLLWSR